MDAYVLLPTWVQLAVALIVLVPFAALGAGLLLWMIDVITNRAGALLRRARGVTTAAGD